MWTQTKVIVNRNYPQVKMNYVAMVKVKGAESNNRYISRKRSSRITEAKGREGSARRGGGGMHESR